MIHLYREAGWSRFKIIVESYLLSSYWEIKSWPAPQPMDKLGRKNQANDYVHALRKIS